MSLMARVDQARSRLQAANEQLSGAQESLRQLSDYEREIVQNGRPRYTPAEGAIYPINGPNDAVMAPKDNLLSNIFNGPINGVMGLLGYDTTLRPSTEDNDFYRDNAQYMPGYNINGIPSGAWAQNAATNHVGHGKEPGSPWDNVRRSLVSQQQAMIDADLAAGGSGKLSFGEVYQAHVNAYDNSQGGGNGFIDPAHFAIAVYGVPLLEKVGINSGPLTGASINLLNNPEDSATEGWVKRMVLAGVESKIPIVGPPLSTFGAARNTATAIDHGMFGEWGRTLSRLNPFD